MGSADYQQRNNPTKIGSDKTFHCTSVGWAGLLTLMLPPWQISEIWNCPKNGLFKGAGGCLAFALLCLVNSSHLYPYLKLKQLDDHFAIVGGGILSLTSPFGVRGRAGSVPEPNSHFTFHPGSISFEFPCVSSHSV